MAAVGLLGGRAAPGIARPAARVPLWRPAYDSGIVFGTFAATWMLGDAAFSRLVDQQAAAVLGVDDFLWYVLKPTPTSPLDFTTGDQLVAYAEGNRQLAMGSHLVWDEGFGDGWTDDDLWGLDRASAETLLYGTVEAVVSRYRGRVVAWSCVNEAVGTVTTEGDNGLRTDVPWYNTIGPDYVAESFRVAHAADPDAMLLLNDFGTETDSIYGDRAAAKRRALLKVLDRLLADGVPVHALGIQGHLDAYRFAELFDVRAYRRWLAEVASRGLKILVTELDVLDNGLPPDNAVRNAAVADVYARFLDVVLSEPAVVSVLSFGLSDRYTQQDEDNPRDDGVPRHALIFNRQLRPYPAFDSCRNAFRAAPRRAPQWSLPRG